MSSVVMNQPANSGDRDNPPGLEEPLEGTLQPIQYLANPTGRRARGPCSHKKLDTS